MEYSKDIICRLLDIYERRNGYAKRPEELRSIQFEVSKEYPIYKDRYDNEKYRDINTAIEKNVTAGLIIAEKDQTGRYSKIKLNIARVDDCYTLLKRTSIPDKCEKVLSILEKADCAGDFLIGRVVSDFCEQIKAYKKLPYDLGYDARRVGEVLQVLATVTKLTSETYIRNFSTALFKDSKRFQREYRSTIESILFDYTDDVVEKDDILGYYNLYENPTYVLIKGNARICFEKSAIELSEMPGGIALSNGSLAGIHKISVKTDKVITVENLTTYHDCDEPDAVYIYLGGYHNTSKQKLLELIYEKNGDKKYYHEGDLDVYGFLILENLISKTQIPFKPLLMDVETIERFYRAGLYKTLTARDRKMIDSKKDGQLSAYKDVLEYMLEYNCKVEQESIKAVGLVENNKM
ncbi:Wadjet anti-phage system protein JetD domain-containing protein [[Clostridium] aminophilum]|uniref:Wadjet anti-phage system protein JetD domain-containing protein n=1 Tax=[Clostridium] aminophilum TaxID=1526 RepID=UPI00331CBA67